MIKAILGPMPVIPRAVDGWLVQSSATKGVDMVADLNASNWERKMVVCQHGKYLMSEYSSSGVDQNPRGGLDIYRLSISPAKSPTIWSLIAEQNYHADGLALPGPPNKSVSNTLVQKWLSASPVCTNTNTITPVNNRPTTLTFHSQTQVSEIIPNLREARYLKK